MSDFFITGTDTDSGKTYVTCALLRDLRRRGVKAAGFKPVACGDRGDARAMREAMGEPTLGLDLLNPVYLRAATAPAVAAELESRVFTNGWRVTSVLVDCTSRCLWREPGAGKRLWRPEKR